MVSIRARVRSLAGMDALSCVLFTNEVVRLEPFSRTTEVVMKFVPLIVNVKAESPTDFIVGEMLVVVGTGCKDTDSPASKSLNDDRPVACVDVEVLVPTAGDDHETPSYR